MKRPISWIANQINAQIIGDVNILVTGSVQTDSRECEPGSLYVARIGESSDGHDYVPQACLAGAVAVIVERPLDLREVNSKIPEILDSGDVTQKDLVWPPVQLVVEDSTIALGLLAKAHLADLRREGNIRVLGVTGSAGKTTTKDLLARICSSVGQTTAPMRSFNNEVGCPLTILRADQQTRFLVLEMGAAGIGQIEYLTQIAPLDVGIELMVGLAHLGGFGSVANLVRAKSELVLGIRPDGVAVLNADDSQVITMAQLAPGQVMTFSSQDALTDVQAVGIKLNHLGQASFTLKTASENRFVQLQLVGEHHVTNALAAATAALALGIELEQVAKVLSAAKADSPHRMQVHAIPWQNGEITLIDDAYNANPDSMRAGLKAASKIAHLGDRRLVAVIGEMLELGSDSAKLHAEIGKYATEQNAQIVIGLGQEINSLLAALAGHIGGYAAANLANAIRLVYSLVKPGDVVFIKGSNSSGAWKIADELMGANDLQ